MDSGTKPSSFNFDPRSLALDTEMGVLIESPRLAAGLDRAFATTFQDASYRPTLREGELIWEEIQGTDTVIHAEEPGATAFSRLLLLLVRLLPVEWLL